MIVRGLLWAGCVLAAVQMLGCGSSDPSGDPMVQPQVRAEALRGACVQTELCIRGFHWSEQHCRCVPDHAHEPHTPHAPHIPHAPHRPGLP